MPESEAELAGRMPESDAEFGGRVLENEAWSVMLSTLEQSHCFSSVFSACWVIVSASITHRTLTWSPQFMTCVCVCVRVRVCVCVCVRVCVCITNGTPVILLELKRQNHSINFKPLGALCALRNTCSILYSVDHMQFSFKVRFSFLLKTKECCAYLRL